jgi:hypothetical protein
MPVNPSTASTVVAGLGVGVFGLVQWGLRSREPAEERREAKHLSRSEQKPTPFARTILGQTCCATIGGWFQVYSGGIAIDTVATRLQAGLSPSRAFWGVEKEALKPMVGQSVFQLRWQLLGRSNLFAGHFVTMLSRFPYLFLNFNSYAQMEQYLLAGSSEKPGRAKTFTEEFACVSFATVISSTAICAGECPKILDQLKVSGNPSFRKGACALQEGPETVTGVIRKYGYRRLMQGYSACFCREFLFNIALLGSPSVAVQLREKFVKPEMDRSRLAAALHGNEEMAAACLLGVSLGFLTNAPDQMKTNIQKGQFLNMREALAWQVKQPGGVAALFGRAAVWRAVYIAHAVIAINFARGKVETTLNALDDSQMGVGQVMASLVGSRVAA